MAQHAPHACVTSPAACVRACPGERPRGYHEGALSGRPTVRRPRSICDLPIHVHIPRGRTPPLHRYSTDDHRCAPCLSRVRRGRYAGVQYTMTGATSRRIPHTTATTLYNRQYLRPPPAERAAVRREPPAPPRIHPELRGTLRAHLVAVVTATLTYTLRPPHCQCALYEASGGTIY